MWIQAETGYIDLSARSAELDYADDAFTGLVAVLDMLGLTAVPFCLYGSRRKKGAPFGAWAKEFEKGVAGEGHFELIGEGEHEGVRLIVAPRSTSIYVSLVVQGGALDRFGGVVLEEFPDLIVAFLGKVPGSRFIDPASVSVRDVVFLDSRPPIQMKAFVRNAILDIVPTSSPISDDDIAFNVSTLVRRPLPVGARRELKEHMTVVRWAKGLDATEIADALSLREQWWKRFGRWRPENDFNEFGDKRFRPTVAPHTDATLYDRAHANVYQAVVPSPDGALPSDLSKKVRQWREKGALANGDPVDQVNLIVPDRPSALAVDARAKELGIDWVFVAADGGGMWDLHPDGVVEVEDPRIADLSLP